MSQKTDLPMTLPHDAIERAAMEEMTLRGYPYVTTPEDGQYEYDISTEAYDTVHRIVGNYLRALPPPSTINSNGIEASHLLERMRDIIHGGRLGDWKGDDGADARVLIQAVCFFESLEAREQARRIDAPIAELAQRLDDAVAPLGNLWSITKQDWTMKVTVYLTDPYVCEAWIAPVGETDRLKGINETGDSMVDAVTSVAAKARETLLGRK